MTLLAEAYNLLIEYETVEVGGDICVTQCQACGAYEHSLTRRQLEVLRFLADPAMRGLIVRSEGRFLLCTDSTPSTQVLHKGTVEALHQLGGIKPRSGADGQYINVDGVRFTPHGFLIHEPECSLNNWLQRAKKMLHLGGET